MVLGIGCGGAPTPIIDQQAPVATETTPEADAGPAGDDAAPPAAEASAPTEDAGAPLPAADAGSPDAEPAQVDAGHAPEAAAPPEGEDAGPPPPPVVDAGPPVCPSVMVTPEALLSPTYQPTTGPRRVLAPGDFLVSAAVPTGGRIECSVSGATTIALEPCPSAVLLSGDLGLTTISAYVTAPSCTVGAATTVTVDVVETSQLLADGGLGAAPPDAGPPPPPSGTCEQTAYGMRLGVICSTSYSQSDCQGPNGYCVWVPLDAPADAP